MERPNDRRTADLASQQFMLLPFYKHERRRRELGDVGDAGSIGVFQGAV